MDRPNYITKTYLPPLEEFMLYLQEIRGKSILINTGPFHQQLEDALFDYLGIKHLILFTNGTIALVEALQVLRIVRGGGSATSCIDWDSRHGGRYCSRHLIGSERGHRRLQPGAHPRLRGDRS